MRREDRSPFGRVYGVLIDEFTPVGRPFRSFRQACPIRKMNLAFGVARAFSCQLCG